MNGLLHLPTEIELLDNPELGSLSTLEAALAVARNCLLAQYPVLGHLHEAYGGGPQIDELLAELLVERCVELRHLINWYRRSSSIRAARCEGNNDIPF